MAINFNFKSSKQAFWPVLLTVASLPPEIRMNAKNIILACVWQAPVEPPVNVILTPVLDKIRELKYPWHSHPHTMQMFRTQFKHAC